MAIEVQHNSRFGDSYETAYAKVSSFNVDYIAKTTTVVIGIWKDEEARKLGKDPVSLEEKVYSDTDFDEIFKELNVDSLEYTINPLRTIYTILTNSEDTKYKDGKKLWDEKIVDPGKEISKEDASKYAAIEVIHKKEE